MNKRFSKIIAIALVVLMLPIGVLARSYSITEGPYLEDNAITGNTQGNKTVTLYKGERQTLKNAPDRSIKVGQTTSDRSGFFRIPFNYQQGVNDQAYDLSFEYHGTTITAETRDPNTFYVIYDRYGDAVASGTSDSDSRIVENIGRTISNPDNYRLVEYKETKRITDLDDYYIIVDDRYGSSKRHYLTGMNVTNRMPNRSGEPEKPILNTIRSGDETLRGYGTNAEAIVIAYDQKGEIIGRGKTNLNGVFKLDLFRKVTPDDIIKVEVITDEGKSASTTGRVEYDIDQYNYKNTFKIDSKEYTQVLNGVTTVKQMDIAPFIKNDRTMLPLRYVGESLGYDVSYERLKHHAVLTSENSVVQVDLNSDIYTIDGREFKFNVKPEVIDGRTMLPITEIALALDLTHGNIGEGRNIEWNAADRTVLIQVNR